MKVRYPLGAAALAALALTPLALGHVTANPEAVPTGSSSEIAFRVPTERDNASTVRVTIAFPEGVYGVTLKRNPGWRTSVKRAPLAQPATFGDRVFRERIVSATWTGARIRPGEYDALVVRAFVGARGAPAWPSPPSRSTPTARSCAGTEPPTPSGPRPASASWPAARATRARPLLISEVLSMRIHRAAAGLVAAALLAGAAAPALAHDTLISSSPRNGAVVKALPKTIKLTFSGPLGKVKRASLVNAGRSYLASARLSPRNVRQILVGTRPGRPGSYVLKATYASGDGHVASVTVKFRVPR